MSERAIATVRTLKALLTIEKSVKEAENAEQIMEALGENALSGITTEYVISIHNDLIATYGGSLGLREPSLLSSALGQAELAKHFSEPTVYDLAATYCYHICMDHPFIDGNKRTACAVMLVCLALHDIAVIVEDCELVAIMLEIANGELNKKGLATVLGGITWSTRPMESYELPTIYQEIKAYHDALFRELAKV